MVKPRMNVRKQYIQMKKSEYNFDS